MTWRTLIIDRFDIRFAHSFETKTDAVEYVERCYPGGHWRPATIASEDYVHPRVKFCRLIHPERRRLLLVPKRS